MAWLLLALVVAPTLTPSAALAQEGCILGDRGRNTVETRTLPGVGRVAYIGGPHFDCEGGVQIFADSSVAYEGRGMSDLIGSVRYVEDGREMRADRARYFTNEGRLQAQGNLRVVDEINGSSIRDGELVYLLETEFRETPEMTVTVGDDGLRPRAVLTPPPDTARAVADSTGGAQEAADAAEADADSVDAPEPYTVDADRIYIRGQDYFTASGDVVIERDSLFAYADSAEFDQEGDGLALEGDARVVGDSYELTGRRIVMTNPGGDSSQVQALRDARLVGEDVLLTSARIVVMLENGGLDRLVATPIRTPPDAEPDSLAAQRPEALVEEFVLTADSLSVSAPGERLQRVFAAGRARSVSSARDSLNTEVLPEVARKDWLEGDTVIIRFQGAPPVPPLVDAGPATDVITSTAVAPDSADVTARDSANATLAGAMGPDSLAAADSASAENRAIARDSTAAPDATAPDEPWPTAPEPDVVLDAAGAPGEPEAEEIVARGRARSLYRLAPNDSTFRPGTHPPAVHYVVGQEIRIRLQDGEVEGMSVTGQTQGVHLEPLRRPTVADSTNAPPDSATAVDTLAAPPGGGSVDTTSIAPTATTRDEGTARSPDPVVQSLRAYPRNPRGFAREEKEHPWKRP